MNWKLVFQLSLFGVVMAVATVYVIPSTVEPWCWLVIFLVCGYLIAKQAPGKFFLHGLMTSLVNSVWITAAHVLLFDAYIAHHAKEAAMMQNMPNLPPRLLMLLTGPIVGVVTGIVLGVIAVVMVKVLPPRAPAPAS